MNAISEKTLKLCIAIHRISNFFPHEEIIKNQLREKANDIFAIANLLAKEENSLPENKKLNFEYNLLSSLLHMNGLLIAARNFDLPKKESLEILENEYQKIFSEIKYRLGIKNRDVAPFNFSSEVKEPSLPQLTTRQIKIIREIKRNKEMRVGDLAQAFGNRFSPKTFQRELQELMSKGLIERNGDYKNTYYILAQDFEKVLETTN